MRTRTALTACLSALALALAACGDDEAKTDPSTAAPSGPAGGAPTQTTPEVAEEGGDPKDLDEKPRVDVPKGDPPSKLVTEDIVKGKGKPAKKGDEVEVQYVGVLYQGGTEFDASWNTGQPFPFKLGAGDVIKGWDEGVAGMRKGGRRKLIIPPDLAYGPNGQPPTIPPDAALVFVVDLLRIK